MCIRDSASIIPICFVIWGTSYEASFTWFMGAGAGLVFYYIGMRMASDRFLHGAHVPLATITTDMEVADDGTMLPGSPTADGATDTVTTGPVATDSGARMSTPSTETESTS